MTNQYAYENLVSFLKNELRQLDLHVAAELLGYLPVGIEVLLARSEWTIDDVISVADVLKYRVSFEVH